MICKPATNGDRDCKGRFTRGNRYGGNVWAGHIARFRAALLRAIREEDVEAVARRLVEQAREGDRHAVELLLRYAVGSPSALVDQLARQTVAMPRQTARQLAGLEDTTPTLPFPQTDPLDAGARKC